MSLTKLTIASTLYLSDFYFIL